MQNKKFLKSKYSKKLKKISIWGIQKKKKEGRELTEFQRPLGHH